MGYQINYHVKLDCSVSALLDSEYSTGGLKRNRIFNEAIRMFCEFKDAQRRSRIFKDQRYIDEFLKKYCES